MQLTGLAWAEVLGIAAAAAAVVVTFYLLKLRRRRVAVPFVWLWDHVLGERQATRLFARLKRWLSLLLALCVVALLAFALGDPRLEEALRTGRERLVLIDASLSMQSTDVKPTRMQEAMRLAGELVDGMAPADRVLVAQLDRGVTPLSPLTADARVLHEAIASVSATHLPVDWDAAAAFAEDALAGYEHGELVLISDGAFATEAPRAPKGVPFRYLSVGDEQGNVGITAFAVRRYPLDKTRAELLIELHNDADRAQTLELTLLGDGRAIDVRRLKIEANGRQRRIFDDISGVDRTLEARIASVGASPRNHLPTDDRAFARLPPRRRAKVLAVSEGNLYLQAALLLDEYLDVTQVQPEAYPVDEAFDVIIFDRFVPDTLPDTPGVYLGPPARTANEAGLLEVRGTLERPFFDRLDEGSSLLKLPALRDVNVAEALRVRPAPHDRVLAADAEGPLLMRGTRNGHRFLAFTFDPTQSDLPLRAAWPLLLIQSIDSFRDEPSEYVSSFEVGEPWALQVDPRVSQARVVSPDGTQRTVSVNGGTLGYTALRSGLYEIRAEGQPARSVAVNLASSARRIAPRAALSTASKHELRAAETAVVSWQRHLWLYLVAAAFLLLAVEWITYHRRWTV